MRRHGPARLLVAGFLAGVSALTALASTPSASARIAVSDTGWSQVTVARCVDFLRSTVTRTAAGFVVVDPYGYSFDQSVLTAAAWQHPLPPDAVKQLAVYGLSWAGALVTLAQRTGDTALQESIVFGAAATLAWWPDTGSRIDHVWNEGANLRRQQSLNCLYGLTQDTRLVPVMEAVASANMDPLRYYGPPAHPAHNHGLMANMALLDAADLLGRPAWATFALARIDAAVDGSFTPAGLSVEQSSAYDDAIVAAWGESSTLLRASGAAARIAVAGHIERVLVRARGALQQLAQPDGVPVPFGDAQAPPLALVPSATTRFVDTRAGVLTGRWSWTGQTDFYAARFGSARRMHGHEDRMSFVWWAGRRPVVVDPGFLTGAPGATRTWTISQAAHSVPVVRGRLFVPAAVISLSQRTATGLVDRFVLTGSPYGVRQTRTVVVDSRRHSVRVTDVAPVGVNEVFALASRWRLESISSTRTRATFVDGSSARLLLSTTGRIAIVVRGGPGLSGGWLFSTPPPARTAGARVVVVGAAAVTTTLTVRSLAASTPV